MASSEPLTDDSPAPLAVLLENHRLFLRYLERRVGDRALAEDILQDAFVRVMDRPDQVPPEEAVVPWFYRTLRNAAFDRFRRREVADRAVEAFARELETHASPEPELEVEICGCIGRLVSTLKTEYAGVDLIRFGGRVDYVDPVSSSFVEESLQAFGGVGIRSRRSPVDAGERPVAI
jgi:RNA polymerase sigma-70 factor (ECF subfamily)